MVAKVTKNITGNL